MGTLSLNRDVTFCLYLTVEPLILVFKIFFYVRTPEKTLKIWRRFTEELEE